MELKNKSNSKNCDFLFWKIIHCGLHHQVCERSQGKEENNVWNVFGYF